VIANVIQIVFFLTPDLLVAVNFAQPPGLCGAQPFLSSHRDRPGALLNEAVSPSSWELCIAMAVAGFGFTA
jgi:hypothetical protein